MVRKFFLGSSSRLELGLLGMAVTAWVVTGVVASTGGMTWPMATVLSGALSMPLWIHRMFVDEDD